MSSAVCLLSTDCLLGQILFRAAGYLENFPSCFKVDASWRLFAILSTSHQSPISSIPRLRYPASRPALTAGNFFGIKLLPYPVCMKFCLQSQNLISHYVPQVQSDSDIVLTHITRHIIYRVDGVDDPQEMERN